MHLAPFSHGCYSTHVIFCMNYSSLQNCLPRFVSLADSIAWFILTRTAAGYTKLFEHLRYALDLWFMPPDDFL